LVCRVWEIEQARERVRRLRRRLAGSALTASSLLGRSDSDADFLRTPVRAARFYADPCPRAHRRTRHSDPPGVAIANAHYRRARVFSHGLGHKKPLTNDRYRSSRAARK
jgi:hypothetical protein